MPKQDAPDRPTGQETGGLGFSRLSMNEIAPASVAEESSGSGARGGRPWLFIVAVLIVLGAGAWLLRNAFDELPPQALQQQVAAEVKATKFSQKGYIQDVSFTKSDTLRVDFASDLDTQDADARATIRASIAAVMNLLAKDLPDRDLTIVGFQGERQVAQGRYRPRTALKVTTPSGERQFELAIQVENGDQDPSLGTRVQTAPRDDRDSSPGGE